MSKGNKGKSEMSSCTECGCALKPENLARHLSKVHGINKTENEIQDLVKESPTKDSGKQTEMTRGQGKGLSSKGLGGKKLSKRERREQRQHAEEKKADVRKVELIRRKKRNAIIATVAVLALVSVALSYNVLLANDDDSSKPTTQLPQTGSDEIRIPKDEVTDSAKFYTYDDDGVEMKIFGVRGSDEAEHVAFDACDVCYDQKKGYVQVDDVMKCNNCGQEFGINSIGTENKEGGCWPSYLEKSEEGNDIVLKGEDISEKRYLFE